VSRESKSSGGGLSVKTLLIAGASSAAATVIVPLLWRPGTLFAAAMTPIIVALVSEAINRPVEKVSAVTVKKTSRYTAATRRPVPDREETFDPLAPPTADELARLNQDLGAAPPPPPRRRDDRRLGLTGRQWRIGLVTGLVAFVAAGAVVTASELAIFGDSVAGGRDRTSLFGGSSRNSDDATPEEEEQEKQRQREENASPTPTPSATETPEEEATPTPTATPTATPVPEQEAVPQETPAPSTQTAPTPAPTPAP
jgi:hypothetical protein